MKKIKINGDFLDKVLAQVMIEPSVVIHKRGGHVYALGSDWSLEIKDEITFKRRKVLRLIRKFNREKEIIRDVCGISYVMPKTIEKKLDMVYRVSVKKYCYKK